MMRPPYVRIVLMDRIIASFGQVPFRMLPSAAERFSEILILIM